MSDYTAKDAVELAFDGNVSAFRDAINDLLLDKIYDAVEMKKYEVAGSYMSEESELDESLDSDAKDLESFKKNHDLHMNDHKGVDKMPRGEQKAYHEKKAKLHADAADRHDKLSQDHSQAWSGAKGSAKIMHGRQEDKHYDLSTHHQEQSDKHAALAKLAAKRVSEETVVESRNSAFINQDGTGPSEEGYHDAGQFDKATAEKHAKTHNGVVHQDYSGKYVVKVGKNKFTHKNY